MLDSSKQIKLGAMMSYAAIAFNIIAGLIYTPWMISMIGQSNYGLYTIATSLITMFIMDFGMGAAVSRFMSRLLAQGEQKKADDFMGLVYKMYLAIDALIFIVLIVVYFFIDSIYIKLTAEEISILKNLYIIVGSFSVLSFPFMNLNGILTAYEKFVPLKFCDLLNKIIVIILMVASLLMGYGVYALVTVNAVAGLLVIVFKLIVIKKGTPLKSNFSYFDKKTLKDIFGFSVWTTIGSLAQRLIFNISPTIIAAVSSTGTVGTAIFGLATTIEGYVYTFATAINGMFMPKISRIIVSGKKDKELMPLMIKIGRIQLMIVGIITVGFITLGKSFIVDIWNKPDYTLSYYCAVLLVLPSIIYLPMQIANTTLIVENKVRLQAAVFVTMGIVNVVLSLILSKYYGAVGASISIFIAYTIRNILMIIIYHKVLRLNMIEFYKKTYLKLGLLLLITMAVGFATEIFNPLPHGYFRFGINALILIVVFSLLMVLFGLNEYEKQLFFGVLNKIFAKIKKR